MDLTERKKQILKRVVEDYIAAAEPVGSKALAEEMGGSVSSATIRNELADLVEMGYLEQPHTSAGRVPSPKGYRLYVNELMEKREVSETEAEEINEQLKSKLSGTDSVIAKAGQMVSSIVNYPVYSVTGGRREASVKRFELIAVDEMSFIVVVMGEDNRVKSQLQRSDLPFDSQRLADVKELLNTHFTGRSADEMSARLMSLSEQLSPELFLVVSKAVEYATIRNELADLVEMGYLEQPHTSAGRVPSPKGYRLYVNELMEKREVSETEAEEINEQLKSKLSGTDSVIAKAGQMVSSIVNYPVYSVTGGRREASVKRFELIAVDEMSFIVVVMGEDNRVKSQLQRSDLPFDSQRLADVKELLNTHFTGRSADEMSARLMSLSEQLSPELFLVVSKAVEYAIGVLEQSAQRNVETAGASQILKMPEYRDVDKAHDLVTFLVDNKEELPVPDDGAPLKILIGPENVNEALKETSVVVASYDIGDGMRGLVGVVGPTRMDYATVTARLSYFADSLTRMFGKNELPPKEEDKE